MSGLTGGKGKPPAKRKPAAKKKTRPGRKKTAPKKRAVPKKRVVSKKRPVARKRPAAKKRSARKKTAAPRKPLPPGAGQEAGRVAAFFRIPVVAVVRLTRGSLKLGDRIWIKGHTTDLKVTVDSMQINHQPVRQIKKGDEAGIRVPSRARRGDRVYLLASP